MVDYEETRENAILSLEQQIKQLVKDAFDKGYQCGYKDRKTEPTISKMEQVDKDINVRSKDEPHIVGKHADVIIIDESQTERRG